MQGLGIAWTVKHTGNLTPTKPVFEFRMFMRTNVSGTPVEYKPFSNKDRIKLASAYAKRNVLITYQEYARFAGRNFGETGYTALLINDKWNNYVSPNQNDPNTEKGPINIVDVGSLNFVTNMYPDYPYNIGGAWGKLVDEKKFYIVKLPTYEQTKLLGMPPPGGDGHPKIPLCRIFVIDWTENPYGVYSDSGFNLVVGNSARTEYQFLKSGFKKKRLIRSNYSGAPPQPLSQAVCKGENHWIERVIDIDVNKDEVELEMNGI
jgi:hypothetical protein